MPSDKKPSSVATREAPRKVDPSRGMSLFVVVGDAGVRSFPIPEKGSMTIGRGEDCTVVLTDDSMSRRHAAIHAGTPPTVEDLGSRNGTRAGGEALAKGERRTLTTGLVIELGNVVTVVQPGTLSLEKPLPPRSTAPAGDDAPVVRDPTMKQLYAMIDVIAPSSISVLLLGETGVGKEVFAEAIHKRSARAREEFLKLNCAALAETLLESELFGHEKGAFTGANESKPGLFETADCGTVFLDEVGEMPHTTQAKLLRVLESGEVIRVGARRAKKVDVRVVAATNRNLEERVEDGDFRGDLYFRLNGISLTIPPLRQRREDIAPLVDMFVARAAGRANRAPPRVSDEARAALETYAWPGNVRELRNVVERAVLLAQGGILLPEHLRLRAKGSPSSEGKEGSVGRAPAVAQDAGLNAQVAAFEREQVVEALQKAGGNQSKAARLLGLSRRVLIYKIEQYGVTRPRKGQPQ